MLNHFSGISERIDAQIDMHLERQEEPFTNVGMPPLLREYVKSVHTAVGIPDQASQEDIDGLIHGEDVVSRDGTAWRTRWKYSRRKAFLATYGDENSQIPMTLSNRSVTQVVRALKLREVFNSLRAIPFVRGSQALRKLEFPPEWNRQIGLIGAHFSDWTQWLALYQLINTRNFPESKGVLKDYLQYFYIQSGLKRTETEAGKYKYLDISNAMLAAALSLARTGSEQETYRRYPIENSQYREIVSRRRDMLVAENWEELYLTKARLLSRLTNLSFVQQRAEEGEDAYSDYGAALNVVSTITLSTLYGLPLSPRGPLVNLQTLHTTFSERRKKDVLDKVLMRG